MGVYGQLHHLVNVQIPGTQNHDRFNQIFKATHFLALQYLHPSHFIKKRRMREVCIKTIKGQTRIKIITLLDRVICKAIHIKNNFTHAKLCAYEVVNIFKICTIHAFVTTSYPESVPIHRTWNCRQKTHMVNKVKNIKLESYLEKFVSLTRKAGKEGVLSLTN